MPGSGAALACGGDPCSLASVGSPPCGRWRLTQAPSAVFGQWNAPPGSAALFGQACTALNLASGLLGNAVVVAFIGLFAAASPGTHQGGILVLLQGRQHRAGEVLDKMAEVLRAGLAGQFVAMALIALTTWLSGQAPRPPPRPSIEATGWPPLGCCLHPAGAG